jgi:hydrogenase expression/formation protein HypE
MNDRATSLSFGPACPTSTGATDCILLAHGEGGRMMRRLLEERITPILGTSLSEDAAWVPSAEGELAVTTDGFVVSPLFFPGGDIGSLAVYGTLNDLAVSGAEPVCLTTGLVIEEGLSFEVLDRILHSMADAARDAGVSIVAGDTKVVPRGACDRLFINTTGIGRYLPGRRLSSLSIREDDALIVSGPIGRHGVAVLAAREELDLQPVPQSDCAPLHSVCSVLKTELKDDLRTMRDATRGGVSAVLHEWAATSNTTMQLYESKIPISGDVRGVCELLGLDPLYVANEGTFMAVVAPSAVERTLAVLRSHPVSELAAVIGQVTSRQISPVVIERMLGILQAVDEPAGAPLPRIC